MNARLGMRTLLTLWVFARISPLHISVTFIINFYCFVCGNKETYEPRRTSILRIDCTSDDKPFLFLLFAVSAVTASCRKMTNH